MRQRWVAAAALGGVAVLVAAAVVALQFGRRNPSPPSLADEPNPAIPGRVAYIDEDGCVALVPASGGEARRITCAIDRFGGALAWLDGETLAWVGFKGSPTATITRIDLATGQVTATSETATIAPGDVRGEPISVLGERARSDEEGRVTVSSGSDTTEVADFDVARYRQPIPVLWSPDGQWLLLEYYPPRENSAELWVISRDGRTRGTLLEATSSGGGVAWYIDGVGGSPRLEPGR